MKKSSKTILFVALAALGLNSAAGFTVGGLEYSTLSDATVTVKKYIEGTDITIPEKVTDPDSNTEYDVVQIERQAFYNAAIKTLSVPASVKSIEPYAFHRFLGVRESHRRDSRFRGRRGKHRIRSIPSMHQPHFREAA